MKKALRSKLDDTWRETIKARDIWCQKHISDNFDRHSGRMNAHHIIFKSGGDRLRWDCINGILLHAIPCHKWDKQDRSPHPSPAIFNKWFRKTNPQKWRYLQRQKKKGIIQFKDYHFELIKNAIETLTPIAKIEKLL